MLFERGMRHENQAKACVRARLIPRIDILPMNIRICLTSMLAGIVWAPVATSAKPDFAREILPILSDKCFTCHGPDAKKDLVRLDSFEGATADLGGYQALNTQDPKESEILARVHDAKDPMPPSDAEKQLTEEERTLLSQWIESGGGYAKHWAFVPPQRPAEKGSIDQWIEKDLKAKEIGFAPKADKATLARRVAFTLVGLPLEPQALQAYLADESAHAYEKLVDRLLDDPRYGEHQARFWLDAVRYGDTHGLHLDNRRGIYPYRDWVVRALNENLPFDEFIIWQLAGDKLPEPTLAQRVATGFVRMNPTTSEGGVLPEEFQAKNNFDRVETLGTVFLGMTFACARCHTHKYDPITQTEYYELMAFFNNTAEHSLDGNKYDYAPVMKAPKDQTAWDEWQDLDRKRADLLAKVEEKSGSKTERLQKLAEAGHTDAKKLLERFEAAEEAFTTTLVTKDRDKLRPTYLLRRGEYNLPTGDPLKPNVPQVMGGLTTEMPQDRLGLARWLTSDEHPLVTRVLINRVWQSVFGHALVRTPEDFGLQGQYPTHPELLDWLAVEFRESGWDLKHMLRLMVTSRTFKQDSAWRSDLSDPENRLFARGPSYRLDAEVLRDLGLWASHLLDPHMGGEGVKPYQPSGMWKAMAHPASNTKEYVRDKGELLYRRSLYVYWKRTSPHPMMTLFDAPSREASCVRRSRTSTPLQSLGLLNETQRLEMARKLAERLLRERDSDSARLDLLFTLLASRSPNEAETQACGELLATMKERYEQSEVEAAALLSTGDAPQDQSLPQAELAAWTQVAVTVLASDIALLVY